MKTLSGKKYFYASGQRFAKHFPPGTTADSALRLKLRKLPAWAAEAFRAGHSSMYKPNF